MNDTNDLNTFQIGARSLDPLVMTQEQWLTNRQMAMVSVGAVEQMGTANVARYPLIHIPNAVISRMLLGGPGPDGSDPGFRTQGAIFFEIHSQAQKGNGMLEQLLVKPTMALLNAAADASLYEFPTAGWDGLPFAHEESCGGGQDSASDSFRGSCPIGRAASAPRVDRATRCRQEGGRTRLRVGAGRLRTSASARVRVRRADAGIHDPCSCAVRTAAVRSRWASALRPSPRRAWASMRRMSGVPR